jgi:hypothetical protein
VPLTAIETLEAAGYTPFTYQLDATRQALSILETHNGDIIAVDPKLFHHLRVAPSAVQACEIP